MAKLNRQQLKEFATRGYVVLPQIVSPKLVACAHSVVADQVRNCPPKAGHCGPHFYFLFPEFPQQLVAPLYKSGLFDMLQSLITGGAGLSAPEHVQISLNIPPWDHHPGGPHIDGLTPTEPDGRPGTFTMLVGIFLTDQLKENAGNLWVWPGSHMRAGQYFAEHGSGSLASCIPYPPIHLSDPTQVVGSAGDVLIAHYMLGHNMGPNISDVVRAVLYFRLRRVGHREHWRIAVQDPFSEFEPVRSALTTS
ncbi:MAG: phytanoyl-CoA dioxygenase family protein [Acidobacteriaceae bacterium]|nr:phytanoyl-CoA dioxygenase family protein [Acidobacteriaceae bacterium]MBV8572570.1 phytanoyl-CoA dioxygenase family protein [Acidobacteriaceae bacterium]